MITDDSKNAHGFHGCSRIKKWNIGVLEYWSREKSVISYQLSVISNPPKADLKPITDYRLPITISSLFQHSVIPSFLICFLLLSCSPQRDNPCDPQSPEYKGEGIVEGRVTNGVGMPIYKALVSTIPPKLATLTDSNGDFVLYPDTGTLNLMAGFAGYVPETTEVHISAGEIREVHFYLNGIPVIQEPYARSCHEDREYPLWDVYWIDVWSEVLDPDGMQDIDSVRLLIKLDTTEIRSRLSFKDGLYFTRIPEDSCPGRNIEALMGRPFVLYAIDTKGATSKSPDFYIPRLIHSLPEPISPIYGDSVPQDTIGFVWHEIKVSYPISYKLIIYNYTALDTVLVKDNILDTTTIIETLPCANYRWRVEGKDDFGDISRSGLANFVVK